MGVKKKRKVQKPAKKCSMCKKNVPCDFSTIRGGGEFCKKKLREGHFGKSSLFLKSKVLATISDFEVFRQNIKNVG